MLLTDSISQGQAESRGTYGYRRVQATLRTEPFLIVNRKLVAAVMADLGLGGSPKGNPANVTW
jgi:hypothetical protein